MELLSVHLLEVSGDKDKYVAFFSVGTKLLEMYMPSKAAKTLIKYAVSSKRHPYITPHLSKTVFSFK